jgi:hypothetical protein
MEHTMAKKTDEAAAERPSESPGPAPARRIRLAAPGIVAVGPYQAGRDYRVPEDVSAEEAKRLIQHKGFIEVTP